MKSINLSICLSTPHLYRSNIAPLPICLPHPRITEVLDTEYSNSAKKASAQKS